jgi:hypothetical protein
MTYEILEDRRLWVVIFRLTLMSPWDSPRASVSLKTVCAKRLKSVQKQIASVVG